MGHERNIRSLRAVLNKSDPEHYPIVASIFQKEYGLSDRNVKRAIVMALRKREAKGAVR